MDTFTREKPRGMDASGSGRAAPRLWKSGASLAVLQQLRACGNAMLTPTPNP